MSKPMGKLVVCPTPLGNLGDMTQRARDTLATADCVFCEDTRVTGKLLAALGIKARLERLDETVMAKRTEAVLARVREGQLVAFCSDAGMPGVSDPGQRLVAAAREAGVPVEVLPGPSAVVLAYVASGFSCPRFYFGGFLPRKSGDRKRSLAALDSLDAVAVFYESPHRLPASLEAIAHALPQRRVAVCRELTKLHEEVAVGSATDLAARFAQRAHEGRLKGEVAIVVDAPGEDDLHAASEDALDKAVREAQRLQSEGALSRKQIATHLQDTFGIARNQAYRIAHAKHQDP